MAAPASADTMHARAVSPPPRRRVAAAYAAAGLLMLGVNLVLVLGMPDPWLLYNADMLMPEMIYRDVAVYQLPIRFWHVSPAPYFIPDMAVYFAIRALTGSMRVAFILGSAVHGTLPPLAAIWAVRGISRRVAPLPLAAAIALTMLLLTHQSFAGIHVLYYLVILFCHEGAVAAGFVCLGALLRWLDDDGRSRWLLLAAAVLFLAAISDRITLVFPVLAVTAGLLWSWRRGALPLRRAIRGVLALVLPFAAAVLAVRLVPPLASMVPRPDAHVGVATALKALRQLARTFGFAPGPIWAVVPVIVAAGLLAGVAALVRRRVPEGPARGRWELFHASGLAAALLAFAVPISVGLFVVMDDYRYMQPLFWFPLLFLLLGLVPRLASRIPWTPRRRLAAGLGLVLLVAAPAGWAAARTLGGDPRQDVRAWTPPLAGCLDRLSREYDLQVGFSAYWHAKETMAFSRRGLWVIALDDGLGAHDWIMNPAWLSPPDRNPPAQRTFVVLDELPVEEIDGRLGPPGDIVVCEPGIRVAIYDAPWRRVKDALVTWKNASAVDAVEHAPRGGSRGR